MANVFNRQIGFNYLSKEAELINGSLSIYTNASISIIHSGMFQEYASLTTVNLANVTTIGSEAFKGCSKLTTVILPKVSNIGAEAFKNCSTLKTVALYKYDSNTPQTFTASIGLEAFVGCPILESLYLGYTTPPLIASSVSLTFGSSASTNSTFTLLNSPKSTAASIYVPTADLVTLYQNSAASKGGAWGKPNLKSKIKTATFTSW